MMDQFEDNDLLVLFGKTMYLLAAVPSYGHLFSPIDVLIKDLVDLYKESNKLAMFKLKNLSKL